MNVILCVKIKTQKINHLLLFKGYTEVIYTSFDKIIVETSVLQNALKVVLTVLMMAHLSLTSIYASDDKEQVTAEVKELKLVKAQLEKQVPSLR